MITFFSIPKPFIAGDALRQRNAILSWGMAVPRSETILFGDEPGIGEFCAEHGLRHIPQVKRNEFGTPLLDSVFELARATAAHNMLAYINADIIFGSSLAPILGWAQSLEKFLIVGRRWNLGVDRPLDFLPAQWGEEIESEAVAKGELYIPWGIDYFVFPRCHAPCLPPFAVGRPKWDNWMIADAFCRRALTIDATEKLIAVHQNHGYGHVRQARGNMWEGPEGDCNLELACKEIPKYCLMSTADCEWELGDGYRLIRRDSEDYLKHRLEMMWHFAMRKHGISQFVSRALCKLATTVGAFSNGWCRSLALRLSGTVR